MDKKKKLIMVDLDGTLVDSLEANYLAYRKALNELEYNISWETYAKKCDGKSYKDFLPELLKGNIEHMEEVHEKKKKYYPKYLEYIKLNVHLVAILQAIKDQYYTALVSTASRANVEIILNHFDLMGLFDWVVTQEDVKKSKPDPSCYIMAREHFGLNADEAVIFEDSATGLAAALASGSDVYMLKRQGRVSENEENVASVC